MEPGLYLTFFTEGEPMEGELPPVGPLEHVVVRDRSLLADRKDGHPGEEFDGGGRSIEAEYEFQRAVGNEPGGQTRPHVRVVAPQGVYLRFVSLGAAAEHDPVPELGPYAVVVVGKRAVEADGDLVAARIGTKQNLWELTAAGGTALVGMIRPDIAFRTRSTVYHPDVKPFRPAKSVSAPAHAPAKAVPHTVHPPSHPRPATKAPAPAAPQAPVARAAPVAPMAPTTPAAASPAHTAARPSKAAAPSSRSVEAAAITLAERIRADQATRPNSRAVPARPAGREWFGALWQLRLAVIGVLVILIAVFSVPSIRSLFTSGTSAGPISTVGVGTSLTSPDWNYTVGSVRRVAKIGSAQARGVYLVVQVAATNRKSAGAQLLPSAFALATASGEEYAASAATSGVYSSDANMSSSYAWPTEFPPGRSVIVPLIFDVTPSVSGTQLVILDIPATRVRLE